MSLLQRLGLPELPSSVEETFVVVTVIGTRGSTPRKINSKMVVDSQGKPWGTIGGGSIEKARVGRGHWRFAIQGVTHQGGPAHQ